jgi:MFS family permease
MQPDLQGYLVAGLAALVLIRMLALWGRHSRRFGRDCTLAASMLVAVALSALLANFCRSVKARHEYRC